MFILFCHLLINVNKTNTVIQGVCFLSSLFDSIETIMLIIDNLIKIGDIREILFDFTKHAANLFFEISADSTFGPTFSSPGILPQIVLVRKRIILRYIFQNTTRISLRALQRRSGHRSTTFLGLTPVADKFQFLVQDIPSSLVPQFKDESNCRLTENPRTVLVILVVLFGKVHFLGTFLFTIAVFDKFHGIAKMP